ncbi:MAG: site-specific DNA-methyltransferase [Azoarcus sp.]|jgi:site-specific DNA-methyltransferase (cytosine-N4-specific)|nr:site-specific DNA-methyltransferase [Azoarcus sp.]
MLNPPNAKQLTFFNMGLDNSEWRVKEFSADSYCDETARQELENRYMPITEVTSKFNRQSVSYQLSKRDCIHRWLKYKEGFSAELIEELFNEMGIQRGGVVLDPFLGAGTTCFVAQMNGIDSMGLI